MTTLDRAYSVESIRSIIYDRLFRMFWALAMYCDRESDKYWTKRYSEL